MVFFHARMIHNNNTIRIKTLKTGLLEKYIRKHNKLKKISNPKTNWAVHYIVVVCILKGYFGNSGGQTNTGGGKIDETKDRGNNILSVRREKRANGRTDHGRTDRPVQLIRTAATRH